jgi:hypothetical protein
MGEWNCHLSDFHHDKVVVRVVYSLPRLVSELHADERSNLRRQGCKDVESQSGVDQSL